MTLACWRMASRLFVASPQRGFVGRVPVIVVRKRSRGGTAVPVVGAAPGPTSGGTWPPAPLPVALIPISRLTWCLQIRPLKSYCFSFGGLWGIL